MTITSFSFAGPTGIDAHPVSIQCSFDVTRPAGVLVKGAALSAMQAKEIAVRVRSALTATQLCGGPSDHHVTVTVLTTAPKVYAPALDLPIALAIAGVDTRGLLVAGELALDGGVRSICGTTQAALLAQALGLPGVLVPMRNAREALETADTAVHGVDHLANVADAIATRLSLADLPKRPAAPRTVDFAEVRGQRDAIAVMEQAVKARAGLLLSGAPGTGKTMIARRIPSVLPAMLRSEQVAVTRAYSARGLVDGLVTERPFRAPHHTISAAALTGALGGTSRSVGEVHLAMHGVLFLDEIAEFSRATIDALADALDRMPADARPLVVASANPCPCGWHGETVRKCTCTEASVARYTDRVKAATAKLGITITAAVQPLALADLRSAPEGEPSAVIAARIAEPS